MAASILRRGRELVQDAMRINVQTASPEELEEVLRILEQALDDLRWAADVVRRQHRDRW